MVELFAVVHCLGRTLVGFLLVCALILVLVVVHTLEGYFMFILRDSSVVY